MTADDEELIDAQYADRPGLRPILDAVLGVRLDEQEPGGRLLAARDLGAANLRIPLASPGDLDDEAVGWLRRAYDESVAPPKPRRKPAPVARVRLTDQKGNPICARVRPPDITWSAEQRG